MTESSENKVNRDVLINRDWSLSEDAYNFCCCASKWAYCTNTIDTYNSKQITNNIRKSHPLYKSMKPTIWCSLCINNSCIMSKSAFRFKQRLQICWLGAETLDSAEATSFARCQYVYFGSRRSSWASHMAMLRSRSDPDWWVAATGVGTYVNSVATPKEAWETPRHHQGKVQHTCWKPDSIPGFDHIASWHTSWAVSCCVDQM